MRIFKENKFLISIPFFILLLTCSSSDTKNNIVAEIGKINITTDQFQERYSNYLFSTGISDNILNRRNILTNMVEEILFQNFDDNSKVYSNKYYQKNLQWAKKQAILGFLKDREIYAKISTTDEELRLAFARLNEKISARHLYAATQNEAYELYELLQTGVSFETLAAQVFSDSTLMNNGGYLGYFTWGDMDPAFEDAAYSMRPGEISKPVQTAQGYSIIQVENRFPHPLLTEYEYLQKKSKLERLLRIRKKKPSELNYVKNTIALDKIKFYGKAVEELFNQIDPNKLVDQSEKVISGGDEPVAEYNGNIFTRKYLTERISELPYYHQVKANSLPNLKTIIKGFYLQDLLIQRAEDLGYTGNEEVDKAYKKMSKNLFMQFKIDDITKNAEIPDSLAMNFYQTNEDFFSTRRQINIQEIIVDRKDLADSIYDLASMGADFGQLAYTYSLRRFTAENQGEFGLENLQKFGNLKDYFWDAPLNKLLKPKEVEGYWGIFKVVQKIEARQLSFDEVKTQVEAAAKFKYQKKIVKDYAAELYKNVKVSMNDTLLASIKIKL